MTLVEEIRRAIRIEIRWLMGLRSPPKIADAAEVMIDTPIFLNPDHASRLLRIEVDHGVDCELVEWAFRNGMRHTRQCEVSESQFEGVSVYVVEHRLPECGWRIINPLRRDNAQA